MAINRFKNLTDSSATTTNRFKGLSDTSSTGQLVRDTILGLPKAVIDVATHPSKLLEPAKIIFPDTFNRGQAIKESFQQKSFQPIKENIKKQWNEANQPLFLKDSTGNYVLDKDGKPVLDREQVQEVINLTSGFLAGGNDISKRAAQNAAAEFAKQEATKKYSNIASRTLSGKVATEVPGAVSVIKPATVTPTVPKASMPLLEKIPAIAQGLPETAITKAIPETTTHIDQITEEYNKYTENLPPDIADTIEPPQKVIEGDKRTPIGERVRALDYLRTPSRVFNRMGIRENYNDLLEGYQGYLKELPKNIDKITKWSKEVPPESNERIFRALDGESIDLIPAEAKVVGEIKTWMSEWADRLGMKSDERISDYITHIFPFGKGGEIPEEIASIISNKIPGSVYNPFLLQRQGMEGYIKDTWKALDAYVKRATRKVNMDPALGRLKEASSKLTDTSQLDYLNSYLGHINLRPTKIDTLIDNGIKEIFGYNLGARPTATISRGIRQMIARAKIGGSVTSFAKNLTQGVNTFAELGTRYTTRGYIDLVKFGSKELEEEGVLLTHFIEDQTYSAVKKAAEKVDRVLFANMNSSELVNRGAAYYGAKAKFLDGKTTAKEFLEAFGKEMPNDYIPTVEDAKIYGKHVASKTQFTFGALDTPVFLGSDIAKTAGQFQTFGLKQQEFILEMVHHKDWAKLARYIATSSLLFQYIGGQFGMSWKDIFPFFKFGKPPAWQFAEDIWNEGIIGKDEYGNKLTPGKRVKSVAGSLFTNIVPAGAQIKKSYEGFKAVNQGASRTSPSKKNPKGTFQYKIEKTPTNYIRGTLFGKSNLPEAKTYYKNKSTKKESSGRFKGL